MTVIPPDLPKRAPGEALAEITGQDCQPCRDAQATALIALESLGRLAYPVLHIGAGRVQLRGCPRHAALAMAQMNDRAAWLRLYENARDFVLYEGQHPGDCDRGKPGGACTGHVVAYMERQRRLAASVMAAASQLDIPGGTGDPPPPGDGTDALSAATGGQQ